MAAVEMLRCGMCGKREKADLMKYDSKKQLNMCTDCYEKQKIGKEARVKSQLITRAIEAEIEGKPEEDKKSYKCASCGYIFARGAHFENTCPYCGKKGTVRKRMQAGAEDI